MTRRNATTFGAGAAVDPAGIDAPAVAATDSARRGTSILRLLFAVPIVLLPNALYVPSTGIAGLNPSNLLFLVLLVALALSSREKSSALTGTGYLTPPLVTLLLVLVLGFITAQWHDLSNVRADLTDLKMAVFYPLFYFVYRRCRQDLHGTRQLILLVLLVAAVAGLTAVYQGVQFGLGSYDGTQRATGPFGDISKANRAGVFYAMFLPMFAAVAILFRQRKAMRVAALVGCFVLGVAILFTYSRQAYLIGLVGLLLLLMRRSVIATVLATLLLLVSATLLPDSVVQRVEETRQVEMDGTASVDSSTASRLEIWSGAMQMWREHPAGVGLGRFRTYIGDYSSYSGVDAHNVFVLMLAECGPLGLAALLWVFWRLWLLARRVRRSATADDPETRALALGFTVVVFSMALGNVYGSPFFDGLVMANFWVLCGLLERYVALKTQVAAVPDTTPIQPLAALARITDRFPLAARSMPGAAMAHGPKRR